MSYPLNEHQTCSTGTPLHCCAVNGSRISSWRSQKFSPLLTICTVTVFMLANLSTPPTMHTPNSSARAFNLLKFALKPEEEEEEALSLLFVCEMSELTLITHFRMWSCCVRYVVNINCDIHIVSMQAQAQASASVPIGTKNQTYFYRRSDRYRIADYCNNLERWFR